MGETDAKAPTACEQPDLQVFYTHWRAKRGWQRARHPCHPLILLEIYKSGAFKRDNPWSLGSESPAHGATYGDG